VDKVRTLVHSDQRLGVWLIAEELNMTKETVRQIITNDLGMRKISTKMVPRILIDDQKQHQLHISSDLLHNTEMFDRVITGNETWCFHKAWNQNTRACSRKHRIHLGQKKELMSCSQFKTLLVCFLDHKGIVHYEFTAWEQTTNQVLFGSADKVTGIWRKRPELWPDKWILHHDNSCVHDTLRIRQFLVKKSIKKMPWRGKDLPTFLTSNATWHYCEVFRKTTFKTVSGSGTIISRSAQLHNESISKATAAASAHISNFFFHRAILGIKTVAPCIFMTVSYHKKNVKSILPLYKYEVEVSWRKILI
jgi:hypothetical protein